MFLKIFLTFWLTVALLAAAQEMVSVLVRNEEQRGIAAVRAAVADARPVVDAYEGRGVAAARDVLVSAERSRLVHAKLLDAQRRSIVGDAPQAADLEIARLADRIAAAGLPNAAVNFMDGLAAQQIISPSGSRFTLIVALPRSVVPTVWRRLMLSMTTRLAAIFLVGGLLCFALARHLTAPIASLSRAVEALADGQLHTRVGTVVGRRHDEVGILARDFDRMAERVEGLVSGQRRLLGDVSHELRSPLARLTVALSLARQGSRPDVAEYFSRIDNETGRLDRLIEQLLTLARLESGVDHDLRERFDLEELVQEVVGDCDFEARAAGKRVVLEMCECASMTGLAELVRSAIENVVRNATRHTAPGTSVEVGLRVEAQMTAHLSVRDHGPGIDETLTAEMFKPFWRNLGGQEEQVEGAGLGLAITDRIVRMHEGRVRATNVGDGGLVVTIDLPMAPTSSHARRSSA